MKKLLYITILTVVVSFPLLAEEIKEVHWVSDVWENYTNADGTGLYHEIVNSVFDLYGIKVVPEYVPWLRALSYIETGRADMTGGLDPTKKFIQSKYPLTVVRECVFFRKNKFDKWEGIKTLEGKRGVWYLGVM